MTYSRRVRRYAAYYRGWCQAFGEHETEQSIDESLGGIEWLFGAGRVGLILPEHMRKRFLKELVGRKEREPVVAFSQGSSEITINGAICSVLNGDIGHGVKRLVTLVQQNTEIHMFLTHHLCYAPGTRIITFSSDKPLVILYKEIEPMLLCVQ